MHLSMILAIDQLNAQILVLLEVYYIPLHVSSTVMLIIRSSNCIILQLVSSHSSLGIPNIPLSTRAPDGHLQSVTIPDAV